MRGLARYWRYRLEPRAPYTIIYDRPCVFARYRRRRRHQRTSYSGRRATRAMFTIVKRLDRKAECNDLPPKPKGMHWRTYNRLADRYDRYDQQWSWEAMRRFGKWL